MGGRRLLRDRLFHRRVGLYLVVGWGVLLALPPRLALADAPVDLAVHRPAIVVVTAGAASELLAGGGLAAGGERIGDDPASFRGGREERIVRARLRELGASAADADAVLARLTPEERAEVAARAPELGAGGSAVAPILAVAIIVGLLVILFFEMIGRRVVSRPAT